MSIDAAVASIMSTYEQDQATVRDATAALNSYFCQMIKTSFPQFRTVAYNEIDFPVGEELKRFISKKYLVDIAENFKRALDESMKEVEASMSKEILRYLESFHAPIGILDSTVSVRHENYMVEWFFSLTLVALVDTKPAPCPKCGSEKTELTRFDRAPGEYKAPHWQDWRITCNTCHYIKNSTDDLPGMPGINPIQYARQLLLDRWASQSEGTAP